MDRQWEVSGEGRIQKGTDGAEADEDWAAFMSSSGAVSMDTANPTLACC